MISRQPAPSSSLGFAWLTAVFSGNAKRRGEEPVRSAHRVGYLPPEFARYSVPGRSCCIGRRGAPDSGRHPAFVGSVCTAQPAGNARRGGRVRGRFYGAVRRIERVQPHDRSRHQNAEYHNNQQQADE